ncbi:MAG: helix-turn-helix domain-containing protein [Opitutales bacterium]|jgi:AraC-like DNA-binding protein
MLKETTKSPESTQEAFLSGLLPGQMMHELFDAVPGLVFFVKDRQSRFMGGSVGFARSHRQDCIEAMIGRTDYDFSPDFLADAFCEDDRRVMETGEPILNRIEMVPTPDGSLDWLSTTKIPLRGRDGRIVGLAGVSRRIWDTDAVYANHPEMRRIVDFVRGNYRRKVAVSDMAREAGISISSQERLFRKTFNLTPLMYLRKTRLNAACRLLRETDASLSDIALLCGFSDQTNMTRAFRLELKITPLRYRRRFSESGAGRNGNATRAH